MDRFDAMRAFCTVVECGSFAGAAERLAMSTSAVSRQIAQLESWLGAQLLQRTTRKLSLTENGQAYFERCLQLLADLTEAEELVGGHALNPRGTLRLAAPIGFASRLAPALATFTRQYPALKFDLVLGERTADLVEEGLDLAIRVGALGSQNLVARRIGSTPLLICASPAYLQAHGEPVHPQELLQHVCLSYAYSSENNVWRFERPGHEPVRVQIGSTIQANNGGVLAEFAAAGMGITRAPDFILGPLIETGRLQPILRDWPAITLPIHAVYPSRRHLSAKVRCFVDFLQSWLAQAAQ